MKSPLGNSECNKILLPVKKKDKTKGTNRKGKKTEATRLSKSQKRKLKKLEEEKERKALELKSIEILEKYKIRDDAYSLLHSSGNMGQVETMRERRLRAVQLSKAGLEVPQDVLPFKKKGSQGASSESEVSMEPDSEKNYFKQECKDGIVLKPMIIEGDHVTSFGHSYSHPEPSFGRTLDADAGSDSTLPNAVAKDNGTCMQGDHRNFPIVPVSNDRGKCNKLQDREGDNSKIDCQDTSTVADLVGQQSVNDRASGLSAGQDGEGDGSEMDCRNTSAVANLAWQQPLNGRTVVHVSRPKEIESKRVDLPIVMMEQEIMEAISEHSTVIVCGETGCGKTTQVPQFLYEAGFGSGQCSDRKGIIGVTQPRRVAVLATAKRVAYELGFHLGKEIGFQVRHDKKIGENCSIKFMTDGILLREVQNDFLLKRYSIIILDEAHERSLSTDILIGMLSRVIQVRQELHAAQQQKLLSGVKISAENMITQLKLVLMSATLRVEDFVSDRRLFRESPPVIEVPTRQFPVTIHFSKRTEIVDYIGQAYKKVMLIHKNLPPGGILVFVTGQREVEYLCLKLQKASRQLTETNSIGKTGNEIVSLKEVGDLDQGPDKDINEAFEIRGESSDDQNSRFGSHYEDFDDFGRDSYTSDSGSESQLPDESDDDEDTLSTETSEKSDMLVDILREPESIASLKAAFEALAGNAPNADHMEKACLPAIPATDESSDKSSISGMKNGIGGTCAGPLHVLPLYAMLPAAAQLRVFGDVPERERLVVVATNVAETSLTIPGIKYVVDTGREKVKNYNCSNGMAMYEVQWISKASAAQRAGRAGRTGPGHCYRLYSSAVFNNIFCDFSGAEITRIPVDGVVLVMKSMGIDKVANFPFPTPPEATALMEAEHCLKALEALDSHGRLTPIGKAMARYPMSPRHSRMLLTVIDIMRRQQGYARGNFVLGYTVAAAAALSFSNPFIKQFGASDGSKDDLDHDGESNAKQAGTDSEKVVDREEKLRQKKLKAMAKMARAKFCNRSSDALTVAYALQLFELAEDQAEFCKNNALHLKTMDEMSKLRKQLLQLIFHQNAVSGLEQEFSWIHGNVEDVERAWRISSEKHPLLLNEEELLGQAICAGWADRVAKRIRTVSESFEKDRKANAVRYQACMVNETVFLHRSSSVCQSAPEFAVYNELLQTKRPYMHGVTSIRPAWLVKYARSLCSFSAPLLDPKPYYDPVSDQVLCWVNPNFGPHLWQLPLHSVPIKNDMPRVSVFAYALLQGDVLPCLKSAQNFMAAPPSNILRPEALGQKRVGNLLSRLKTGSRTIDSRSALREVWGKNPQELHSEIRCWFQERFQHRFEAVWAQMHQEVLLEAQELFPKRRKKEKKR